MSNQVSNSELLRQLDESRGPNSTEKQNRELAVKQVVDTMAPAKVEAARDQLIAHHSAELRPQLPKGNNTSTDATRDQDADDDFEKAMKTLPEVLMQMKTSMQTQMTVIDENRNFLDMMSKLSTKSMNDALTTQQANITAENNLQAWENSDKAKAWHKVNDFLQYAGPAALFVGLGSTALLEAGSFLARFIAGACVVVQLTQGSDQIYESKVAFAQSQFLTTLGATTSALGEATGQSEFLQETSNQNSIFVKKFITSLIEFNKAVSPVIDTLKNFYQLNIAAANAVAVRN